MQLLPTTSLVIPGENLCCYPSRWVGKPKHQRKTCVAQVQSSISAKPRAKFEIQDKSVLILRSEHPFGTSLAELGTELWHVMCQGITASHSVCEQCISLGFLGSWITQEAQTLTSITYIFKLMFFYSFLTPGTQWVRDLILWHHKDFQARSRVCQGIYYSARANMLMSL